MRIHVWIPAKVYPCESRDRNDTQSRLGFIYAEKIIRLINRLRIFFRLESRAVNDQKVDNSIKKLLFLFYEDVNMSTTRMQNQLKRNRNAADMESTSSDLVDIRSPKRARTEDKVSHSAPSKLSTGSQFSPQASSRTCPPLLTRPEHSRSRVAQEIGVARGLKRELSFNRVGTQSPFQPANKVRPTFGIELKSGVKRELLFGRLRDKPSKLAARQTSAIAFRK